MRFLVFNLPFPHSAADVAAARSETDLKLRAERMLSLAERIGCRKFVTAPDVVEVYTNLLRNRSNTLYSHSFICTEHSRVRSHTLFKITTVCVSLIRGPHICFHTRTRARARTRARTRVLIVFFFLFSREILGLIWRLWRRCLPPTPHLARATPKSA